MKAQSEITFKEAAEYLGYEKVTWNGKVVWEDNDDIDLEENICNLKQFQKEYENKIIYEMNIKIIKFHHSILDVKGE